MSKVCHLRSQVLLFLTRSKNGKGEYFRGGQEPKDLTGRAGGMRAVWLADGGTDPSCSWFILFPLFFDHLVLEICSDLPWRNLAHTLLLQQDCPSWLRLGDGVKHLVEISQFLSPKLGFSSVSHACCFPQWKRFDDLQATTCSPKELLVFR